MYSVLKIRMSTKVATGGLRDENFWKWLSYKPLYVTAKNMRFEILTELIIKIVILWVVT
jgi:hypothetical protein